MLWLTPALRQVGWWLPCTEIWGRKRARDWTACPADSGVGRLHINVILFDLRKGWQNMRRDIGSVCDCRLEKLGALKAEHGLTPAYAN
jgi:hypothetical protein